MPRVAYAVPQQGFRPRTNPLGALGRFGMGSQAMPLSLAADPNCAEGMPYDVNGDLCPGADPNCANLMPYDVNGNPCPGTSLAPSAVTLPWTSAGTPAPTSGAPTPAGITSLTYTGTWQTTTTKSANDIIQSVLSALPASGLGVINFATSAGVLANTKLVGFAEAGQQFTVTIQMQATNGGFAKASDAGSIVNHLVYAASGQMPLSSNTVGGATPVGSLGLPSSPSSPGTLTTWLENNALFLVIGAVVVMEVAKKI